MTEMPADMAWALAGVDLADDERDLIASADSATLTSLIKKAYDAGYETGYNSAPSSDE